LLQFLNRNTSYQIPKEIPLFGQSAAKFGWVLGANAGYVGQGMIMGPRVCISMLGGAVVGFGILAPLAVSQGWATKSLTSRTGSAAWVSWISMAIMIADSITSLAVLLVKYIGAYVHKRFAHQTYTELPDLQEAPVKELHANHDSVFSGASGMRLTK
jgi:uncharacterized oligopeptide transporter (OPT) family protein